MEGPGRAEPGQRASGRPCRFRPVALDPPVQRQGNDHVEDDKAGDPLAQPELRRQVRHTLGNVKRDKALMLGNERGHQLQRAKNPDQQDQQRCHQDRDAVEADDLAAPFAAGHHADTRDRRLGPGTRRVEHHDDCTDGLQGQAALGRAADRVEVGLR